jgi:hypothetical protein
MCNAKHTVETYAGACSKLGAVVEQLAPERKGFAKEIRAMCKEVIANADRLKGVTKHQPYDRPLDLLPHLSDRVRLGVEMILATGMRRHEMTLIRDYQINTQTKEINFISKGGQHSGNREIPTELMNRLSSYIAEHGEFRLKYSEVYAGLKTAAAASNQEYHKIHGLRVNFARALYLDCLGAGKTPEDAEMITREAINHHRKYMTRYYLGI